MIASIGKAKFVEDDMNDQVENPYKAPESDVAEVNQNAGRLGDIYDRFSAWAVFGLNLITLGAYGIYWVYARTQKINPHIDQPIGKNFINVTLILMVLYYLSSFFGEGTVAIVLGLAGLIGYIMLVVWFFKLRAALHTYVGLAKGDKNWAGPILTFFFSCIYLQYKINAVLDKESEQ